MHPLNATRGHSALVMAFIGLLLYLCCALIPEAMAAVVPVPPLAARVTDQTNTLDAAQRQALEAKLTTFESSKGVQIAILIVPTIGDETIEQYSIRVVGAWKIGRKNVDDGVLMLVAKDDRKLRIEVGRGLEGVIPDALANRIVDGFITPRFTADDYAGGLDAGVDRIIGLVNGEALPQPSQAKPAVAASSSSSDATTLGSPIPSLTGHIVNETYLLTDAQVRTLDAKLTALEKIKGRQIAVLLVESTGGETGAQYSDRVFDAWKLGDDGVLIMVSEAPYDERIVAGRGLAGVFPHGVLRRVLDEDMSWPQVKLGDTAGEINAGVDRIIGLENGEAMPPPPKPESTFSAPSLLESLSPPPFGAWLGMIVGLIFIFLVVSGLLSWKGALLRGSCTSVAIGGFLLILGSGILFALGFAALAFYLAVLNKSDGPEPSWEPDSDKRSNVSVGSMAWSVLGGIAGGLVSSGGGGSFSGGGGNFSGGGASGSW